MRRLHHDSGFPAGLLPMASDRLFFFAAALYGALAVALLLMVRSGFALFPAYGTGGGHGHEMLFGFAAGVTGGFLLTAVPNWTGAAPLTGWPLLGFFLLWLAGRLAFLAGESIGAVPAALIDSLFLPAVLFITLKAVVQARKWRDMKVLGPLALLTAANLLFHAGVVEADAALRLAVAVHVVLITVVGGRLLPSDTRNMLRRLGRADLPPPHGMFDTLTLLCGLAVLALWCFQPQGAATAAASALAALLNGLRLARWRGWALWPAPLPVLLHGSYVFVLGFAAVAGAGYGWVSGQAALHVFAVGAMGCMMFSVMLRMRLKQSGRPLVPGRRMVAAWLALVAAAFLRFFAGAEGSAALSASGLLWCLALGLLARDMFACGPAR